MSAKRLRVVASGPLRGEVRVPGDKSIAHRWLILAAAAHGESELKGVPAALDVRSTASCLTGLLTKPQDDLHAWLERRLRGPVRIWGLGYAGLVEPHGFLDCGNSGTTMRLLAGVAAGRPFPVQLDGDRSLRRRPMERVARPLRGMGAEVRTQGGLPPLWVSGGTLRGISYRIPVPSAQVKGAILLAGVQAEGVTAVEEQATTRDHTERCLAALGAPVLRQGGRLEVRAFQHEGFGATVPGDPSSAAFLLVAAALVPGSEVTVRGVAVNPSRTGFLEVLRRAGAEVEVAREGDSLAEPFGAITVRAAGLRPIEVRASELAAVVDEVPALAALAAHAPGPSRFEGAGELRVKESDRLAGIITGLRQLGGEASTEGESLVVGGGGLAGGTADARGDHRLAMALVVASMTAGSPSEITGAEWIPVSFPGFAATLRSLGAAVEERA